MTSIFTHHQNRTRQPKHTPGGKACENAHIQDLHTPKSHFVLGARSIYVPLWPRIQRTNSPTHLKTQPTQHRKVHLNVTKPNFTPHTPGEIAHIPGLDTPKLHYAVYIQLRSHLAKRKWFPRKKSRKRHRRCRKSWSHGGWRTTTSFRSCTLSGAMGGPVKCTMLQYCTIKVTQGGGL